MGYLFVKGFNLKLFCLHNGLAPSYISPLFYSYVPTQDSDGAFCSCAHKLWNSLPMEIWSWVSITACKNHLETYRGTAPFHRLIPNKRFEPVFSTVIMAVCSLFNRMLLLTDLIPVHLLYCGQTVMIGCNHTSFEWTRAVRHIYGIIRHMQGLYMFQSACNV